MDLCHYQVKLHLKELPDNYNGAIANSQCRFKRICVTLCLGQILAGLLSAAGIFTALLTSTGFNLPLLQNVGHYSLLGSSGLIFSLYRKHRQSLTSDGSLLLSPEDTATTSYFINRKYLLYLVTAFLDFHAFWATLSAYAYTSVTSIQLVDCLSIPTSMVLSFLLLKRRFSWTHFVGAVICLIGASLMVVTDTMTDRPLALKNVTTNKRYLDGRSPGHSTAFGDMLAVVGAILFGISNVMQEYMVDKYGGVAYLRFIGLAGATFSGIYCLLVERTAIVELITNGSINNQNIPWSSLGFYLAFVIAQCSLYLLMALTITEVSAVFINLSLLAADVYSLLAGILLFHVTFHYLYFISFAIILLGVGLFASNATRTIGSTIPNVCELKKLDLPPDVHVDKG